jgi:hypothetical protein
VNGKKEDMVQVQGGKMIPRSRAAYMLKEVDEVDDGSKVLVSFSGTLYGKDAKTGSLLRMDKLGGAAPVKGKAAKKAAKKLKRRTE